MTQDERYTFQFPNANKSIIRVMGVGGGGSNATTHMFKQGIRDVEFVVCNTDVQALNSSSVEHKLQIGQELTGGLGVGADPKKGKEAALESEDDIRATLQDDTKMLFVTAGLGGGTGTGAAPEVARIAKEFGILTVGIVTLPFDFEGNRKMFQAQEGLKALREHCDTVIVVLNQKLMEMYGRLSIPEAFAKADNVLSMAAKGIAELITVPGIMNVDFEDVKTVMSEAGESVMGTASADGENRAKRVVEDAVNSPLLNRRGLQGATKILLNVYYDTEYPANMDEFGEITNRIRESVGNDNVEVIPGLTGDANLGDKILLTLVATGFNNPLETNEADSLSKAESENKGSGATKTAEALDSKGMPLFDAEKPQDYTNLEIDELEGVAVPMKEYNPDDSKQVPYEPVQLDDIHFRPLHQWTDQEIRDIGDRPAYLRRKGDDSESDLRETGGQ